MALIFLSILIPLIGGLFLNSRGKAAIIGCLGACLGANIVIACLPDAGARLFSLAEGLDISLHADAISKLFAVLMSFIWLLACVFSFEYMRSERDLPRYYRFFMLTLSALMAVCYAGGLTAFFMAFEAMTLLSMPLVLHERTPEARAAALKYLGFSMFGAAAALSSLFILGARGVSTAFVPGGGVKNRDTALLIAWLIAVMGFGAKAGMFPLHSWLPTAHPVAPSPASAVLSGIITKCGVIGIIRITFFVFGAETLRGTWAQYAALTLALITIFLGSMMAYTEKLLKKRLAYSTVSQVSYVIFGLLLINEAGFSGAITQAAFHALAKGALFMWAGAVIRVTGLTRADELRGLARKMPLTMWGFLIAALSLIGIPPTGGFAAKWLLARGALEAGVVGYVGVAVLIISALLTAGYLLPIAADAFFPGGNAPEIARAEAPVRMLAPVLILALLSLILGVFPNFISGAVSGLGLF